MSMQFLIFIKNSTKTLCLWRQVDEISAAPAGSGGFYVGMSLQSGEEISRHPRKEFDGWLVGGNRKARRDTQHAYTRYAMV